MSIFREKCKSKYWVCDTVTSTRLPYEIDSAHVTFITFRSEVVVFRSRTALNTFCSCVIWLDSCWRKHGRHVTSSIHPLLHAAAAGRVAVTQQFSDLSFPRSCLTSTAIGPVSSRRTVPAGDLRPSGKPAARRSAPTSLFVCTFATSRACPVGPGRGLGCGDWSGRCACHSPHLHHSTAALACQARRFRAEPLCDGVFQVAADNVRRSVFYRGDCVS